MFCYKSLIFSSILIEKSGCKQNKNTLIVKIFGVLRAGSQNSRTFIRIICNRVQQLVVFCVNNLKKARLAIGLFFLSDIYQTLSFYLPFRNL
jgi:fucose 4-O-acetylase-like acetyltransferase